MRWASEVTFEEARRHLGVETQRQWSDLAIHRTTPLLFGLFSLVTLWASELAAKTGKLSVLGAAWYKKSDPTFSDCLATVRRVLWAEEAVRPILWRDDFSDLAVGEHEPPKNPGLLSSVRRSLHPTPPDTLPNRQSPAKVKVFTAEFGMGSGVWPLAVTTRLSRPPRGEPRGREFVAGNL